MTEPNVQSFFDTFSSSSGDDLMTAQLAADQIEPAGGVFTTTDPIVPDMTVRERLEHLDSDLYDLQENSHLMKLMKVLLGGAGAGGLRKQVAVARMQNMISGMHFLDLDHFYGALFGLRRATSERFNTDFDPFQDGASSDDWDSIQAKDASYRDRIVKFARAIYLGATYRGIKAMVEALTGAECDVFESWTWVDDSYNATLTPMSSYTYAFLSATVTSWSQLEGTSWSNWGGGNMFAGRTGQKDRSEFVIQVSRPLSLAEQYEILRVISVFKPVFTNFTVYGQGAGIQIQAPIRTLAASSEYWEVVSRTVPNPRLNQPNDGIYSTTATTQPRPAFSRYQGEGWYYNGDITTVNSYALDEDGSVLNTTNDETVVYSDNSDHTYRVNDGVMTAAQAMTARLVDDGVMTSVSYAANRGSAAIPPIMQGADL